MQTKKQVLKFSPAQQAQMRQMASQIARTGTPAVSKMTKARVRKPRLSAGQGTPNVFRTQAMLGTVLNSRPSQRNGRVSSQPLEGDEFVATVSGSTTFATTTYAVNPGQSGTFPQGSVEAALWQKYKVRKVLFYYKPLGGPVATNNASGKVLLSANFDSSAPIPSSRSMVEDTATRIDGLPYEELSLSLPPTMCNQNAPSGLFIRPAYLPGGADIKTYDAANLTVSTDACPNTNAIGELRVRYSFQLEQKILRSTNAPTNNQVALFQSSASETGSSTTVAYTMLMATTTTNGIGAVNTAGSVVLPAGNYLLDISADGENTSAADNVVLDVQKNGTSLITSSRKFGWSGSIDGGVASSTVSLFASSAGTDAFTVVVTPTFSSGTENLNAVMRITAV